MSKILDSPAKLKIWIDNYGAGSKATPLEVHTYWHEIIKLEDKSKRYHQGKNDKLHKDLYNSYNPAAHGLDSSNVGRNGMFRQDYSKILVVPTNKTAGNVSDLHKIGNYNRSSSQCANTAKGGTKI